MQARRIVATTLLVCSTALAQAQSPPPYGAPIGIEAARKAVAAAAVEARTNNWNVAIAVVDSGGNLVAFERLDGTQIGSIQVAQDKATTANNFRRPTKAMEDGVAGGRNVLLRLTGAIPIEGGVPIVVDGRIIGAIGVSGVTSAQDAIVARAGADSLTK